jgi:hypothetical protein
VAAVPQVYGAGTLRGARVIDPVYSGSYQRLLAQLRQSSTNHLISNIMKDRVDEKEILLKPHGFGDGRRMIVGDFVRLSLNLPNPRIKSAYLEGL